MRIFRYSELYIILFHIFKRDRKVVLLILMNSLVNMFLKNISRQVFGFYNDYIPILGQGSRPIGAKNCGYINRVSKSFGFPSGHSQFAAFYSTLMISLIASKKELKIYDKIIILLLTLFVILMMVSRIKNGCHTLEQTIFGALIGIVLGRISYKFFYNIL